MTFLNIDPEVLHEVAQQLATAHGALSGQNSASAPAISEIAPAGTDEVSLMQAAHFSHYGRWYEQLSARALQIQEMLIRTLHHNAESYKSAEQTNAASSASPSLTNLIDNGAYQNNYAYINQASNWGAAASDLIQLQNLSPATATSSLASAHSLSSPSGTLISSSISSSPSTSPAISPEISPQETTSEPIFTSTRSLDAEVSEHAQLVHHLTEDPVVSVPSAKQHEPISAPVPSAMAEQSSPYGGFGRPRYGRKPKVAPRSTLN